MGQPGVYEYTIINGESLKDYSYGNYSPNTNYNAAIYVYSIGYVITHDPGEQWDDTDSCGALRVSTTTPTTLRATFTRMATSTSTTMGLGFPAGGVLL